MDIIGTTGQRARQALAKLVTRAEAEGWKTDRIEHEKSLFQLEHEVSLCSQPGCTEMVHPIPGFLDVRCGDHGGRGPAGGH